jgi:predicted acyltransferase
MPVSPTGMNPRLARHVIFRSIAIFLTGLAINRLPDYNLHTLRIPGVLQRIALCYLYVFSVSP